jgi:methyl-accepting chemotaxis protein
MFPVSVITTPAFQLVKTLFVIGLVFVGAGFIAAWLVGIRIAEPIIRMTGVMNRMTDGDLDVTIPDAPEGTEIGKMAHAMKLFRDNALELREFENREIATHLQTEREKRELMDGIIARFEESIGGIIDMVSAAALALNTFSQDMSITAEASSELSSQSANSSEEASRNVAAISSATDELTVVGGTISERAQAARDGLDALTSYLQSLPSDTALADVDQIIPQIAAISQEAHGICESISEQENAIQEVARNIALVSQSAHDLSQTTQSVKTVAKETGDAAMQINVAAADLAQQAGVLQSEVTSFLDRIRGRHPGQTNPEQ